MKRLFLCVFLCVGTMAMAQHLKMNLDSSGSTFVKASVRANFWARYYQTNPNSIFNGEPTSTITDFSIRRLRMNFQAQITPRLFFYSNFGTNDINLVREKEIRLDVLDMYAEYEFSRYFAFGIGEIGWGSSRGSMRSSKTMMGLDAPLFSLFNVNKNDDLARSLGVFVKGQIGKWSYVATVKNPIKIKEAKPKEGKVDYAKNSNKQYSAYLKYDFWQMESNKTSYSGGTGTYIGAKKIANLAIGGVYQGKMTSEFLDNKEHFYDYKNLSMELFVDTPISVNNQAATLFLGYYHTDYGRNYLRNVGANDIADSIETSTLNGSGNDFPMMGTGNTLFFQGGYLLAKSLKHNVRIQPNISVQHSVFNGLKSAMVVYDFGVNFFFKGHDQKLTLSYQNRPIFDKQGNHISRKGMFVLQYQIEIN